MVALWLNRSMKLHTALHFRNIFSANFWFKMTKWHLAKSIYILTSNLTQKHHLPFLTYQPILNLSPNLAGRDMMQIDCPCLPANFLLFTSINNRKKIPIYFCFQINYGFVCCKIHAVSRHETLVYSENYRQKVCQFWTVGDMKTFI